ncbi:MAG: ABC transporter ATP-binding protein [Stappia sp.]|uniref:ABC transporter substrate-binding protein n=1 Tax=Stappia sp. TaxID=1870903 RepID=UPI000C61927E|nr:ABC transporter substrate-binding protein [Stappia sp.]MAA96945.1 ABC transporter ATP-binding protein [Stappia sp.]MBM19938.1 ABC transporter ATP-binding protein [Stappia sp.]
MRRLAGLAGTALAFALLTSLPAFAADRMSLLLDWYVNPDHGPIIVAKELGYFDEAGLDVEIVAPADPSAPPKLVAAGKADLAISYQPQIHLQIAEGLPLKRVGTLIASPLNCLMVKDDGPIRELSDLKGRKIGYSVSGVETAQVRALLARAGLSADEVEMVNVNWSLAPSVMSGQVDAVIGAYRNVELIQMELEGVKGRCFFIEEQGVPPYDELIYVANPDTMDADKVRRFLDATERATQYIMNHPDKSFEIYAGYAPELDDELNKRSFAETIRRFALRPAALDEGRYARFETFLKENDLIETERPVSDIAIDITAR